MSANEINGHVFSTGYAFIMMLIGDGHATDFEAREPLHSASRSVAAQKTLASRLVTLAGLISIGLWGSGSAVAHGANGGNSGGGHGAGHGHGHHRGGRLEERGSTGGGYGGRGHGGWGIPGHGYYFVSIPSYCKRVYWEGVAYYYADDVYYEWSGTAGAYQQVQPPAGLAESIQALAPGVTELFVFPNGAQTVEQLQRDREECHRWAVQQVGLDPNVAANRTNYLRADQACLEARDYSVQ